MGGGGRERERDGGRRREEIRETWVSQCSPTPPAWLNNGEFVFGFSFPFTFPYCTSGSSFSGLFFFLISFLRPFSFSFFVGPGGKGEGWEAQFLLVEGNASDL